MGAGAMFPPTSAVLSILASLMTIFNYSSTSIEDGVSGSDVFVEERATAYRDLHKSALAVVSDVLAVKALEPGNVLDIRQYNMYYMLSMRVTIRAFFADVAAMRDAAADVALHGDAADARDIFAAVGDLITAKGEDAALEHVSRALVAFRERARIDMGLQQYPTTDTEDMHK